MVTARGPTGNRVVCQESVDLAVMRGFIIGQGMIDRREGRGEEVEQQRKGKHSLKDAKLARQQKHPRRTKRARPLFIFSPMKMRRTPTVTCKQREMLIRVMMGV